MENENRKIVVDSYQAWTKEFKVTLLTIDGRKHVLNVAEARQLLADLTQELSGRELGEDE
jgi:hypothetical protein